MRGPEESAQWETLSTLPRFPSQEDRLHPLQPDVDGVGSVDQGPTYRLTTVASDTVASDTVAPDTVASDTVAPDAAERLDARPLVLEPEPAARDVVVSPEPPRAFARVLWTTVFLVLGLIGAWLIVRGLHARSAAQAGKTVAPRVIPVQVGKVTAATMPVNIQGVGNITAYSTVPVTSQVTGQVLKIYFTQGQFVRAGAPLFAIDPRPYQATLVQMRANVRRDQALVEQARKNVMRDAAALRQAEATLDKDTHQERFARGEERRYGSLLKQGFVTQEQYWQEHANANSYDALLAADRAAVGTAAATVEADQAAVRSAQESTRSDLATVQSAVVQLGYTNIRAPIGGRTGSLAVYAGAIVPGNGATTLVTIDQITPIYVSFAVPERYLPEIRQLQNRAPLRIDIDLGPGQPPETGTVTFIDNTVDTTTGTIILRSTFPNRLHHLWPGQYATVRLRLRELIHAITVPSQAIQPGQQGDYVFVVKPDKTVEMRNVVTEESLGDASVVKSGVRPGETVVTDGQMQLKPGARVRIVTPTGSPLRARSTPPATPSGPPGMPGSTGY